MDLASQHGRYSPLPPVQNGRNQGLEDYQMQMLLLEQQHKKRRIMTARGASVSATATSEGRKALQILQTGSQGQMGHSHTIKLPQEHSLQVGFGDPGFAHTLKSGSNTRSVLSQERSIRQHFRNMNSARPTTTVAGSDVSSTPSLLTDGRSPATGDARFSPYKMGSASPGFSTPDDPSGDTAKAMSTDLSNVQIKSPVQVFARQSLQQVTAGTRRKAASPVREVSSKRVRVDEPTRFASKERIPALSALDEPVESSRLDQTLNSGYEALSESIRGGTIGKTGEVQKTIATYDPVGHVPLSTMPPSQSRSSNSLALESTVSTTGALSLGSANGGGDQESRVDVFAPFYSRDATDYIQNEAIPSGLSPVPKSRDGSASPSDTTSSASEESPQPMVSTANMSDRDLIQHQYETIEELRSQIKRIERQLRIYQRVPFLEKREPRMQVLYRVTCDCEKSNVHASVYEDHPEYIGAIEASHHIHGRLRLGDVDTFLDKNKEVVILVYKDFGCRESTAERQRLARIARQNNLPPSENRTAILCSESFSIISATMCSALKEVLKAMPNVASYPRVEVRGLTKAPYTFFYHDKSAILNRIKCLSEPAQEELGMFINYLEESSGEEFRVADEQFEKGLVSNRTMQYLFQPGQIIVHHDSGEYMTYFASSYLTRKEKNVWSLDAWCWRFDGAFFRERHKLRINWDQRPDEIISIESLDTYPLMYSVNSDLENRLRKRGQQFWSCRVRKYVCYSDKDTVDVQQSDVRYMIDYSTWNAIANRSKQRENVIRIEDADQREYLTHDIMVQETPPEPMLLLLPHNIVGFDMINKKWSNLKVSNITDVVWNKEAFRSLVIEEETKICVQALVTHQVTAEKSTDLVYGKGNGLVILLHGPPGTGKTLTAESVAELAEKPLYRVTCGDIGTDPSAVERHLQAALNLGKAWGCVVLLDEADIFLEERSLHDLARNALVSVFLRALEYYDGILILTTNRVGTFDEAFKSRIQLSLPYQRLTETQRGAVWDNFLRRLVKIDEDNINIEDLQRNVRELARYDMNGRQIRNALTTARQLALFAGELVDFKHLKRAIKVSTRFDQYLRSVKHGATDDDIARDEGVR